MNPRHQRLGAGLVQQPVQIVASLRSHDLTLFVGRHGGLKQLAKLLDGEAGVADDTAQGKCVDGVVTRDREDARLVGHNDVFALADHGKPGLFESADGIEMIDARNLGQG